MRDYLRLRQICLAAPSLHPVVEDLAAILGLAPCVEDGDLGAYGLCNALLPVDAIFIEFVAPVQDGTAVGRFLERTGGHGGYMAIFDCSDPERRRRHAEAMGVRAAHVIRHDTYHGVQLHPRDCRAAIVELNHTEGGDDLHGAYDPAGPSWQDFVRTTRTRRLAEIEVESPAPGALAEHWSRLLEAPLDRAAGEPRIVLEHGAVRFVAAADGRSECLSALRLEVSEPDAVLGEARRRGYRVEGDAFHLGGVWIKASAAP